MDNGTSQLFLDRAVTLSSLCLLSNLPDFCLPEQAFQGLGPQDRTDLLVRSLQQEEIRKQESARIILNDRLGCMFVTGMEYSYTCMYVFTQTGKIMICYPISPNFPYHRVSARTATGPEMCRFPFITDTYLQAEKAARCRAAQSAWISSYVPYVQNILHDFHMS